MNFYSMLFNHYDAPQSWGVYYQDSACSQMEALVELHDNIMFYLVIILFGVAWIMVSIIGNYINSKSPISNKYLNHGNLIELIWTITPALILILIAFPSFKLLYLMDEVTDPSLTVFVEGHQWYWSYQYPDFTNDDYVELEFNSYSVPVTELSYFSEGDSSESDLSDLSDISSTSDNSSFTSYSTSSQGYPGDESPNNSDDNEDHDDDDDDDESSSEQSNHDSASDSSDDDDDDDDDGTGGAGHNVNNNNYIIVTRTVTVTRD